MKPLLTFTLAILISAAACAQTLGVKFNPAAYIMPGEGTTFGSSTGLCYSQTIYKFFGFTTGIDYTEFKQQDYAAIFATMSSDFYYYRIPKLETDRIAEIPFDFTFILNERNTAKCPVYFTIGYAFGQLFGDRYFYADNSKSNQFYMPSKNLATNTFRMGIETRLNPVQRLNIAMGIQYCFASLPDTNCPLGGYSVVSAYIKTGLNFLHKKGIDKNTQSLSRINR